MYVREYGPSEAPVILALHPMGITGEDLYRTLSAFLQGSYCVIAPDQGGHGQSGHYISLEDEVRTLKAGLDERGYDHFCLLYAASMGVTAAYELLKDSSYHFDRVWLDGAGFISDGPAYKGMTAVLTRAFAGLCRMFPGILEKNFSKNYGPEFGPVMRKNFMHFNGEDVLRIFEMFSRMSLVPLSSDVLKNLHLEWGEKDGMYERSRPALEKYFADVPVVLRPGYGHCAYMAFHTAEYVRELEAFINPAGKPHAAEE